VRALALGLDTSTVTRAVILARHDTRAVRAREAAVAEALAVRAIAVVVAHLAAFTAGARNHSAAVGAGEARITEALAILAVALATAVVVAGALRIAATRGRDPARVAVTAPKLAHAVEGAVLDARHHLTAIWALITGIAVALIIFAYTTLTAVSRTREGL